jgi:hypothetical protein
MMGVSGSSEHKPEEHPCFPFRTCVATDGATEELGQGPATDLGRERRP